MSEAFERISQGLKEAIAHASGEEVEGAVIHNFKVADANVAKQKIIPVSKEYLLQFLRLKAVVFTHIRTPHLT